VENREEFDETKWQELKFLSKTWDFEDECEKDSDREISNLGVKAPKTLNGIGIALSYLDALASCAWGCSNGDHALERLFFRVCNRTRAALRLSRLGFYDESLMLARANGETANLLVLFSSDRTHVEAWRRGDSWTKKPVEIRKKLEENQSLLPINGEQYKVLSGLAVHNSPSHAPAAHNVIELPVTPGTFQREGFVLTLNELARPLPHVILAACELITLPKKVKLALLNAGYALAENTGAFSIDNQARYWAEQRRNLAKMQKAPSEIGESGPTVG
jgi:hypothetical protein